MGYRNPHDPPRLSRAGGEFLETAASERADRPPVSVPAGGAGASLKSRIDEHIERVAADLVALSHSLYREPELGFEEFKSVAKVRDLLAQHGHTAEVGVYGLKTALEARISHGPGPTIVIMAEYDALPGVGHGCGHNVICAAGVGAFLAAAPLVEQVGGTLILQGTPAEENGGGKELMIRAGCLDGVDAAMMVHPFSGTYVSATFIGLRDVAAHFHGLTAHASATPFMGVNALDAAVAAYTGAQALRQHMLPTDRIHGTFTDVPGAPNVIPDQAGLLYFVRSATMTGLGELSNRLNGSFLAGALTSGCQVDVEWDLTPPCLPMRSNQVLEVVFAENFRRTGEQIGGHAPAAAGAGSTDMGNVSQVVPSIHPMIGVAPAGVSLHTREFADHAATPRADELMLASARALAATAIDLLADEQVLDLARAEFAAAGGSVDVDAALRVD